MNNMDQYYYDGDESDSSSWESDSDSESEEDIYFPNDRNMWNSNLFNVFCYNHALHLPLPNDVQPPTCST